MAAKAVCACVPATEQWQPSASRYEKILKPLERLRDYAVARSLEYGRPEAPAQAVQWNNDNETWAAICNLHADSELVAFWNQDGTVSIETPNGRVNAAPGAWVVKDADGCFHLQATAGPT